MKENPYEVRTLTSADVEATSCINEKAFREFGWGNLAHRALEDFADIFQAENYSAGMLSEGKLLGCQIWTPTSTMAFDARRYPKVTATVDGGRAVFGKGTVID